MQRKLENLVLWLNVQFNIDECQSMSFFRSKTATAQNCTIKNLILISVSSKIHRVVLPTSNLHYPAYIQSINYKAYKTLVFIIRISSDFKLSSSLKFLYCSVVRSILDYASVLWVPYTASESLNLERVLRCFISFAGHVPNINHTLHDHYSVLHALGLVTLAARRCRANFDFLQRLIVLSVWQTSLNQLWHRILLSLSLRRATFKSVHYYYASPLCYYMITKLFVLM